MKRSKIALAGLLALALAPTYTQAADWQDRAISAGVGAAIGYGTARLTESDNRTLALEPGEASFYCQVKDEVCIGTTAGPEETLRKKLKRAPNITKSVRITEAGKTTAVFLIYK